MIHSNSCSSFESKAVSFSIARLCSIHCSCTWSNDAFPACLAIQRICLRWSLETLDFLSVTRIAAAIGRWKRPRPFYGPLDDSGETSLVDGPEDADTADEEEAEGI